MKQSIYNLKHTLSLFDQVDHAFFIPPGPLRRDASSTASLGGLPSVIPDIPICAVLMTFYI